MQKYLESQPLFSIKKYDGKKNLSDTCIAFSGNPRKHPYDDEKILLIENPYTGNTLFYEFRLDDIQGVEDLPNLVTENGESVSMAQIWIEKGSVGIRYEPFEVDKPLKFFKDSEVLRQVYSES